MSNALSIDMFKPFQSGSSLDPSLSPSSGPLDVVVAAVAGVPGGNRSICLAHYQSYHHPRPLRRNCVRSLADRHSNCLVHAMANVAAGHPGVWRHDTELSLATG